MNFEKYITLKSLNRNSIAKYISNNKVVLIFERNSHEISRKEFTADKYKSYLESIPERFDVLAYMLDDLFDLNMLK